MQFKVPTWIQAILVFSSISIVALVLYLNTSEGKHFYINGEPWGFSNEHQNKVKSLEGKINKLEKVLSEQKRLLLAKEAKISGLKSLNHECQTRLSEFKKISERRPVSREKELYYGEKWSDVESGFSAYIIGIDGYHDPQYGGITFELNINTPESSLRKHELRTTDKWEYRFDGHAYRVTVLDILPDERLVRFKIEKT